MCWSTVQGSLPGKVRKVTNFNASIPAVWATIEIGVPVSQQFFKGEKVSYAWVVLKGSTDARVASASGLPGTFAVESVRVRVEAEVAGKQVSVGLDVDPQCYCTDYSGKNRTVRWLYNLLNDVLNNAHEGKFLAEGV